MMPAADPQLAAEADLPTTGHERRVRMRLSVAGAIGLAAALFWLAMAVIGPLIAPHEIGGVVDQNVFGPMSVRFPLGTDYLGRDILSRVLFGARYTVGVSLAATLIACFGGVTLGMLCSVAGGWLDAVLSRGLDALNSIPHLMFGLVVVAALGSSIPVLIGTLAVLYAPGSFRIARSLGVNINTMDFVQVARARGEGFGYIIREEIFPNIVGPVLADLGLRFVFIVLLLSGLSFLGLGVQPPYADWGSLVRENISGLAYGAPAIIMPAVAIATLTIGVNLFIDNLPRRRGASSGGT